MPKKTAKQESPEWQIIDARGVVLGRLATQISSWLLGKHRLDSAPHQVAPVHVVVVNTDLVAVTGDKEDTKTYHHYSGYPGGVKTVTLAELRRKDSTKIVWQAVAGMLPKNSLRDKRLRNLKLYRGPEHPHQAQVKQLDIAL